MSRGPRPIFTGSTRTAEYIFEGMYGGTVKLNQPEIVSRSGVSPAYISGIIKKGRLCEDDKAIKIAKALGGNPDDLLTLLYLDRIEKLLNEAPGSVQRRLKPVRDTVKSMGD